MATPIRNGVELNTVGELHLFDRLFSLTELAPQRWWKADTLLVALCCVAVPSRWGQLRKSDRSIGGLEHTQDIRSRGCSGDRCGLEAWGEWRDMIGCEKEHQSDRLLGFNPCSSLAFNTFTDMTAAAPGTIWISSNPYIQMQLSHGLMLCNTTSVLHRASVAKGRPFHLVAMPFAMQH